MNFYRIRKNLSTSTITYSNTAGVDFNFDAEGLVLYPNPLRRKDLLNVSFGDYFSGPLEVNITTITGKIIKELKLEEVPEMPLELDLKKFIRGTYILQVSGEGFRPIARRFVIVE